MDIFFEPVKTIPMQEILVKKTEISQNISEIKKNLALYEKGSLLTGTGRLELALFKDIIPHKDIPWDLYTLVYERSSLVYNGVSNTADFAIQAGYGFEAPESAKSKIEKWMDEANVNFELLLRNIFIQLQVYGNAYLDISDINFPKLLPPQTMFVKVEKGGLNDGLVTGYKQILDAKSTPIEFTREEIIHFKINDATNPFYGMSELKPVLGALTRYANWSDDLGQILHRFASPFIHWQVGTKEIPATATQLSDVISMVQNRLPGEDLVTSMGVDHKVVQGTQGMIQVDNLVKNLQDEIIAGLRIPEIFARGGITSNKAVGDVEMQAFDRKCKALIYCVTAPCEDYLFPKITGNANVKIIWNEFSAEGELIRAQRLQTMVASGIPLITAVEMVGWKTWIEKIEKSVEEQEQKNMEQQQAQMENQHSQQMELQQQKNSLQKPNKDGK